MSRTRNAFRYPIFLAALLALLLLPNQQVADAHAYSAAYTTIQFTKSSVDMTYTLDGLSVIELLGGDTSNDLTLEPEQFNIMKDSFLELIRNQIVLNVNDKPQSWTHVESLELLPNSSPQKVELKVQYAPVAASQVVSLTDQLYSGSSDKSTNYVDLVTIEYGSHKANSALSGKYREWSMQMSDKDYSSLADSSSNADSQETDSSKASGSGWYSFFVLGINHILSGYDHLLFLFSLLIARQKFKQYAAMITAFTIAHSITLTLTVLGVISVPSHIVEPLIALSICFVAIDNMIRKQVSGRWILTFLFGLVHGMGFADILQEMDIPRTELAADLISFNLGIETVQLTLVAAALPLLYWLHSWKFSRRVVIAGSSIAFMLGGIWLIDRL
ncbi:HupE/UreJ family protein (plasmid) [Paenibacillus cellulosilyticus]|uniref:HupE/UreJ family protein n=1 Tax=Paenibacillus cellulosilyticus TaxID=375489 RepID=UPI001580AD08|nr:HupE/UreJ family protein [Paenibacillus cellulosilyticus]QKS48329.1 HupE/UreJ family protein [Paenibacillus cellulosilyticus]